MMESSVPEEREARRCLSLAPRAGRFLHAVSRTTRRACG